MQSPAVSVEDVSGNPVPGQDVVASIASGGGSIGGTTTVSTNGSGSATFGNLSITASVPGARTLQFTAGSAQQTSGLVHVSYSVGLHSDVQYCGSNDPRKLDAYIPSGSFPRPLPVAAFIHGGGWVSGEKESGTLLNEVRDLLLADGYVVVSLDYRLATASTNKWPTQINDVKCAIRHLRAEASDYGFDGARIGVWGPSAGGHLASMLGVTDATSGFEGSGGYGGQSSSVSVAVAIGGISDLTAGFPNPELDFGGPEDTFSSWPGPSDELNEASPIWWESANDPPFLLVHGDQDTTVDPDQATRLDGQLDAAGVDVTLQMVTNGGHNLDDVGGTATPSIAQVALQIADFFDFHISGDP
jgi:acetyl esterase/lipase